MKLTKPKRLRRIKITQEEIDDFPVAQIKIDPFWMDVYNPDMN